VTHFFETLFYRPRWYHWVASILLLPLSLTYGIGMWIRRKISQRKQYPVSIISVGNLVIGGSGKTPFVIALAAHFSDRRVAIISRGYGRQSSGLVEVSREGEVLVAVGQSGDEAMLMAIRSPHASVIVSEKREPAIERAIEQGAELILLDDGFNRVEIEKYEILLEPEKLPNRLPLPSGPMREFAWCNRVADMQLKEGQTYHRKVAYADLTDQMVLVTAIADPVRLDPYLPEGVIAKVMLEDHAYFDEKALEEVLVKQKADSILTTEKDWVKMQHFKLPISRMKLELQIDETTLSKIEAMTRKKQ
jgi:tetraacyldisaccharide 4'-kinase